VLLMRAAGSDPAGAEPVAASTDQIIGVP
jgi:hypothetical protein